MPGMRRWRRRCWTICPKPAAAADAGSTDQAAAATTEQAPVVYGDAAYGTGALLAELEGRSITAMTKVAAPTAPGGHFTKGQFRVDLDQAPSPARPA